MVMVTQDHPQYHHLLEHVRLPLLLFAFRSNSVCVIPISRYIELLVEVGAIVDVWGHKTRIHATLIWLNGICYYY